MVKTYYALVHGRMEQESGQITLPRKETRLQKSDVCTSKRGRAVSRKPYIPCSGRKSFQKNISLV